MASTPARLHRDGNVSWYTIYGIVTVVTVEDEHGKFAYHADEIIKEVGLITSYEAWQKSYKDYTNRGEWRRHIVRRASYYHKFKMEV